MSLMSKMTVHKDSDIPFHVLDTLVLSRFDFLTCISRSVCANRQYQGRLSEIIDFRSLMDTALFCGCSLFLPHSQFLLWGTPAGEG